MDSDVPHAGRRRDSRLRGREQRGDLENAKGFAHLFLAVNEQNKEQQWVILPTSPARTSWDCLMVVFVLYNAVALPLDVAFELDSDGPLRTFDIVVDILFYVDIVLNFLTSYEVRGSWEHDRKKIARHYLAKWFWVDFAAAFPYEVVWRVFSSDTTSQYALVALKGLKNLRLMRLSRLFKFFDRFQSLSQFFRMFRLLIGFFLVSHWFACIFHFIGVLEDSSEMDSWLAHEGLLDAELDQRYITSLYWAFVTITTVGFGDVVPVTNNEKVFVMCFMIVGACIYATIFGNISLLISNMGEADNTYRTKMESVNSYMKDLELPEKVQERVRRYYDHLWSRHHSFSQSDVLFELPSSLHTEIASHLHAEMFSLSGVFVDLQSDFVRSVARALQFSVSPPQEYIVREGETASKLFFIRKGIVEVSSERCGRITFMQDGAWFGGIGLLLTNTRTAYVKALTNCDLYYISKRDIVRIWKLNPDHEELFNIVATTRMKQKKFHSDEDLVSGIFRDMVSGGKLQVQTLRRRGRSTMRKSIVSHSSSGIQKILESLKHKLPGSRKYG